MIRFKPTIFFLQVPEAKTQHLRLIFADITLDDQFRGCAFIFAASYQKDILLAMEWPPNWLHQKLTGNLAPQQWYSLQRQ